MRVSAFVLFERTEIERLARALVHQDVVDGYVPFVVHTDLVAEVDLVAAQSCVDDGCRLRELPFVETSVLGGPNPEWSLAIS